MVVRSLIEMGIVQDQDLDNCEFDMGEMMYIINKPHITVLATQRGPNGRDPIDMDRILAKYGDFNFGHMEFECLQLSRMDAGYTPVIQVSL
jgi:hypothetical protein